MDANNENKKDASSAPKRLSRKVYFRLSVLKKVKLGQNGSYFTLIKGPFSLRKGVFRFVRG